MNSPRRFESDKVQELSQTELAEFLDNLSLQSLSDLEDYAIEQGYNDIRSSVAAELRMRSQPRLAKITAGWVVVTAVQYNIITGATAHPEPEWAFECYPELDCGVHTSLLALVKFAFDELFYDEGKYDDPSIIDDVTYMCEQVEWHLRQDDDLREQLERYGEKASASNILAACETILRTLWTAEGRLFNDIAQRLQNEHFITAKDVRELVKYHTTA